MSYKIATVTRGQYAFLRLQIPPGLTECINEHFSGHLIEQVVVPSCSGFICIQGMVISDIVETQCKTFLLVFSVRVGLSSNELGIN